MGKYSQTDILPDLILFSIEQTLKEEVYIFKLSRKSGAPNPWL